MKKNRMSLLLLVAFIFSCKKYTLEENQFIGNTGGTITTPDYSIIVPQGALNEGYFIAENKSNYGFSNYYDVNSYLFYTGAPIPAKKNLLSTNTFVSFDSSKPNTDKPLLITMRYNICDAESSDFCGLSDLQALPYSLNKKDYKMDNILSDSLNYTPLPVLARDTINKTITFETSDLTRIYIIAREL